MLPLIFAAVEHAEEGSKAGFYIAAGVLASWAVLVGAIGVTRPAFPRGDGAARGVMLISGVLMVATMAAAVLSS
ncbi:MAG TPA: hypothetical protein VFS37_00100 [Conexibacter sp.]|nr:hypothetical protein [Conexibacter sp.]